LIAALLLGVAIGALVAPAPWVASGLGLVALGLVASGARWLQRRADVHVQRVLRAESERAATQLARERAFSRYASHELRTPISAIKVQLERYALRLAAPEALAAAVGRQAARLESLLEALLTLARVRDRDPLRVALPALLAELLDDLPSDLRPRLYISPTLPEVEVQDAALVAQATGTLLDNALKHSRGPVHVDANAEGTTLTLRVRDMGPGIPAEALRRVGNPLEHPPVREDGHGLGLSLATLIARALDGRLLLRNTDIGLEASLIVDVLPSDRPATPAPDPGA
jgi:signal transduction histidine kinase